MSISSDFLFVYVATRGRFETNLNDAVQFSDPESLQFGTLFWDTYPMQAG